MLTIYIYRKVDGAFMYSFSGTHETVSLNLKDEHGFTLICPPMDGRNYAWREEAWQHIELTSLPAINNPEMQYDDVSVWDSELNQWIESPELLAYQHVEHQALMWERIKQLRLDKMTGGVYVESIDKHLHSDEVSSIQYAQIGTAITMGMFQPMNWKAMDGDFIELTEPIFRELQVAMIVNTQTIYAKAEYHKYMMMQADDPLNYDYNEGW